VEASTLLGWSACNTLWCNCICTDSWRVVTLGTRDSVFAKNPSRGTQLSSKGADFVWMAFDSLRPTTGSVPCSRSEKHDAWRAVPGRHTNMSSKSGCPSLNELPGLSSKHDDQIDCETVVVEVLRQWVGCLSPLPLDIERNRRLPETKLGATLPR
jgi:hypothetical protein